MNDTVLGKTHLTYMTFSKFRIYLKNLENVLLCYCLFIISISTSKQLSISLQKTKSVGINLVTVWYMHIKEWEHLKGPGPRQIKTL